MQHFSYLPAHVLTYRHSIMNLLITVCFIFIVSSASGQIPGATPCTNPGQNPSTAFPVCGTSTFSQASVPLCGGKYLPAPTCNTNVVSDVNPFWYKFTCFKSGTLGFQITPHTNSEDYDWQLFDVTGQNPNAVYSNINLVVSCNWSGEGGATGASNAGSQLFVCDGFGKPLWSRMPDLVQGHEYLLLVSHFTNTQSGYNLSFNGGTAIITDSTDPKLGIAEASCSGDVVRLKLNKKMKCSSIAANGSDFYLMPGNIPVSGVVGFGCAGGFDSDSLELKLSAPLSPGNYSVHVKQGSDNNTVLDYCDKPIQLSDFANFSILPLAPTPMDSLVPVKCKPQSLKLVFSKPVLCSSVAPDGSDFTVSGPYNITISGASTNCASGATASREIVIQLSQPLYNAGSFNLTLKTGTDGNTILDECSQETPSGSFVKFVTLDTVNADFIYSKNYGCSFDTVNYFHPGNNGVNSWNWTLDEGKTSSLQSPQAIYSVFNQKTIQLAVSNGFCSDTSNQVVVLDNFLKADFTSFADGCPDEPTGFTSKSQGQIVNHNWTFGDGSTSNAVSPVYTYGRQNNVTTYTVTYTITDNMGCQSSAQKFIRIYSSCLLAVPNAFSPNQDGINDFLGPLNAIKAEQLDFKVFNRWGQLLFQTKNWKNGWDGKYQGILQGTGVYVWYLTFIDRDSKQPRQMKGTAVLIR